MVSAEPRWTPRCGGSVCSPLLCVCLLARMKILRAADDVRARRVTIEYRFSLLAWNGYRESGRPLFFNAGGQNRDQILLRSRGNRHRIYFCNCSVEWIAKGAESQFSILQNRIGGRRSSGFGLAKTAGIHDERIFDTPRELNMGVPDEQQFRFDAAALLDPAFGVRRAVRIERIGRHGVAQLANDFPNSRGDPQRKAAQVLLVLG